MLANRLIGLARSPGGGIADPTEVSGLLRWYEGDVLGLADGTAVTSWTDQSTSADHAVDVNPPTYKVGVANGHDAIRFDGTNDYMTCAMLLNSASATAHIFVVADCNASGNRGVLSTRETSGSVGWALRYTSTTGLMYYHSGQSPNVTYSIADQLNIIEIQRDGLDVTLGANGSLGTPQTLSGYSVSSLGATRIGADYSSGFLYMNGDIAEIVIYDHVLSAGDRTSVLDYLTAKY